MLLLAATAGAAEPRVTEREMPRFPAVAAKDAAGTFKVRPGFRVELAASEPNVASPVAIAFDEDGRLYAVEMVDYSERRDERLGRIRLLEDRDDDGVFERSVVFAEGMGWPTAVFPWAGGVFVGCSPDILYLKDTDGDGRADEKRIVFTGFGAGASRLNVQGLLNSFNWGLDNRIHGAASTNGGVVRRPEGGEAIDLRGKGFSFDPRTLELRAENGGGQHGLSFDDWGRHFVCSNSHHIQTFAYDRRYAGGGMPNPLIDIAVDGPAAEVYRASPEEPWRVIRTKWRVGGLVTGPIEGGGRSAGYFTGATGVTIYRGDAYGPEFLGDAFIGDAGGNLVHRKKVIPDGVVVKAMRPPDEQKTEFLAGTDTWFRPVQFANGPDGCLYVIDMYRQTIEHPWSLPESLKKHLDLNAGNDRGRIWRIAPDGFRRRANPKLRAASTEDLVKTLGHANGWHRDTAARLLFERQDVAAVPHLRKLTRDGGPLAQLHALYAIKGLGTLSARDAELAMVSAEPAIRRHGLRLAEEIDGVRGLELSSGDADRGVRYQLALSLGVRTPDDSTTLLARIAEKDPDDAWVEAAVVKAAGDDVMRLFEATSSQRLRETLAGAIGKRGRAEEVKRVIELAAASGEPSEMMRLARAVGGLESPAAAPIVARAKGVVADADAALPVKVAAAGVLGRTNWDIASEPLLRLLRATEPLDVQLAAVAALEEADRGGRFAAEMVSRWRGLAPRLREAAVGAMIKRPERARALLAAIEAGTVGANEVSPAHAAVLKRSPDASVKAAANRVFAEKAGKREDVVKSFAAATDLPGDAARGRELFRNKCAACHRSAGEGHALGPDLETVRNAGREKLLTSILDPNREVAPNLVGYAIETRDGDLHVGVVASEDARDVTLRMAFGQDVVVPRARIKSMKSDGLSLMPEGLEEGLEPQDLADLLRFVIGD